jgi:hypothetical protein
METEDSSVFIRDIYTDKKQKRYIVMGRAMAQRLVAGLSPRKPGSIHVGFVVDKVALLQVSLRILRLSPVSIIPPSLSKLSSSGG